MLTGRYLSVVAVEHEFVPIAGSPLTTADGVMAGGQMGVRAAVRTNVRRHTRVTNGVTAEIHASRCVSDAVLTLLGQEDQRMDRALHTPKLAPLQL